MASARPSPPKPHELRSGASAAATPSRSMTEFDRARSATGATATTAPTLPPRPTGVGAYGTGGGYGGSGLAYGAGSGYGYGGGSYGAYGGTSRYGSSYGSGYGGYGSSYGGYGSSYGSSYGGYGSGYGGRYGGSRYGSSLYGGGGGGLYGAGYNRGGLGPAAAGARGPGEAGPGVVTWIDQFAQVVDTFGRFAQLLDMNCDALYGSFSSVLRLFESMSELRREFLFIFQTVTLYRLLRSLLGRFGFVGRALGAGTDASSKALLDVDSFQQFQGSPKDSQVATAASSSSSRGRRFWPFLLFLVSAIAGPLLINRLWRLLRSASTSTTTIAAGAPHHHHHLDDAALFGQQQQQQQQQSDGQAPLVVQALYDFVGSGSDGDLPFSKGALIRVLRADPDQGWWEGETGGRVGLFPANFVQAVAKPHQASGAGRLSSAEDADRQQAGSFWPPDSSTTEPLRLHLGDDVAAAAAGPAPSSSSPFTTRFFAD